MSAAAFLHGVDGSAPACQTNPLLIPRKAVILYLADRLCYRSDLVVLPAPSSAKRRRKTTA